MDVAGVWRTAQACVWSVTKKLLLTLSICAVLVIAPRQAESEVFTAVAALAGLISTASSLFMSSADPVGTGVQQNREMIKLLHERLANYDVAVSEIMEKLDNMPEILQKELGRAFDQDQRRTLLAAMKSLEEDMLILDEGGSPISSLTDQLSELQGAARKLMEHGDLNYSYVFAAMVLELGLLRSAKVANIDINLSVHKKTYRNYIERMLDGSRSGESLIYNMTKHRVHIMMVTARLSSKIKGYVRKFDRARKAYIEGGGPIVVCGKVRLNMRPSAHSAYYIAGSHDDQQSGPFYSYRCEFLNPSTVCSKHSYRIAGVYYHCQIRDRGGDSTLFFTRDFTISPFPCHLREAPPGVSYIEDYVINPKFREQSDLWDDLYDEGKRLEDVFNIMGWGAFEQSISKKYQIGSLKEQFYMMDKLEQFFKEVEIRKKLIMYYALQGAHAAATLDIFFTPKEMGEMRTFKNRFANILLSLSNMRIEDPREPQVDVPDFVNLVKEFLEEIVFGSLDDFLRDRWEKDINKRLEYK